MKQAKDIINLALGLGWKVTRVEVEVIYLDKGTVGVRVPLPLDRPVTGYEATHWVRVLREN